MKARNKAKQIVFFLGILQLLFTEARGQFYTSGQDLQEYNGCNLKETISG